MASDHQLRVYPPRTPRPLDPDRPRVDVIILNWNGREHVRECLDSLRELRYPAAHLLVIDQASTDGSQQLVLDDYPHVTLLALDRNLGYSRANNVAIDWALAAGAAYVFLLNNDTTVAPDCLDVLVATAEADPALGIVSPKNVRYADPAVVDIGVRITWWSGSLHSIRPWEVPPDTRLLVSDYAWGCALLIRRAVLERIGGFDARYVMYHDDADLCLRARRHGWLTATRLDTHIRHKLSVTTDRIYLRKHYYRLRNLFLLVMLHAPLWVKLIFPAVFVGYQLPRQLAIMALARWRRTERWR
jgi:GT2 family glycosyltransferase